MFYDKICDNSIDLCDTILDPQNTTKIVQLLPKSNMTPPLSKASIINSLRLLILFLLVVLPLAYTCWVQSRVLTKHPVFSNDQQILTATSSSTSFSSPDNRPSLIRNPTIRTDSWKIITFTKARTESKSIRQSSDPSKVKLADQTKRDYSRQIVANWLINRQRSTETHTATHNTTSCILLSWIIDINKKY